jgi:hypothetical protein
MRQAAATRPHERWIRFHCLCFGVNVAEARMHLLPTQLSIRRSTANRVCKVLVYHDRPSQENHRVRRIRLQEVQCACVVGGKREARGCARVSVFGRNRQVLRGQGVAKIHRLRLQWQRCVELHQKTNFPHRHPRDWWG